MIILLASSGVPSLNRGKGLSWKAVAQPHLPMALLAQKHRDWGCLLVLPPQTSNVPWEWWGPCQAPFAVLLRKCECLQIARSQNSLAWKGVAQPHLPMALLAQRHRAWGCLPALPPQTSFVTLGFPSGLLRQPCSQNANVCRYLAARREYPGKLLLSLIFPRHCSHRGTEPGAACLSCHLKLQM